MEREAVNLANDYRVSAPQDSGGWHRLPLSSPRHLRARARDEKPRTSPVICVASAFRRGRLRAPHSSHALWFAQKSFQKT